MDNASIDETKPTPLNQNSENPQETRPTAVNETTQPGEETRPVAVNELPAPDSGSSGGGEEPATQSASSPAWKWLAIFGVLTLLVIAGMSAFGGYRAGMDQRNSARSTQVAQELSQQYNLALQDMDAKRFDLARQRFEFIVQQDPNFPNVTEKLAAVLLEMSITATPTFAPTPTLTPTPDLRGVEELYSQAKQALLGGDWTTAIDALLKLRKDSPDYHAVELDGMLYVALRNRGMEKIKNRDLEGGTYDLALAERFGPLDVEASSYRSWADLYSTGASYWDIDWQKAVEIFSQLWRAAPYLSDASGWTSTDRYRIALTKYGDQLAQSEEWCQAQKQYEAAQEVGSDPKLQPTAAFASEQCAGGETGKEKPSKGATPEPTGEAVPTQSNPPEPTVTAYP